MICSGQEGQIFALIPRQTGSGNIDLSHRSASSLNRNSVDTLLGYKAEGPKL